MNNLTTEKFIEAKNKMTQLTYDSYKPQKDLDMVNAMAYAMSEITKPLVAPKNIISTSTIPKKTKTLTDEECELSDSFFYYKPVKKTRCSAVCEKCKHHQYVNNECKMLDKQYLAMGDCLDPGYEHRKMTTVVRRNSKVKKVECPYLMEHEILVEQEHPYYRRTVKASTSWMKNYNA